MPMTPASRLKEHPEDAGEICEQTDFALSLAAQMPGSADEKRKTVEFLKTAIEWIGEGPDSRAKRNALSLAVQMPNDHPTATTIVAIAASIIAALFGADGVVS